jgi:simple sugar transport system substrate-binding protein
MNGMWESSDTWGGMSTGMVGMADYTNMPEELKVIAAEIELAILNGDLNIFEGISDDSGLLGMMNYLDGIDATVPN